MKKLIAPALLALLLAGCATATKMEGDQVVNHRMAVKVTEAWNKIALPGSNEPFDMWTQEGVTLDHLRLWAGLKPGQPLITKPYLPGGQTAPRVPTFADGMAPDQLVNLFELLYSIDGSRVSMARIEPASFAGEKGLRFEFTVARKSDDLQLRGVGWLAVKNGELFAATFVAPRLNFYPRLAPKAEAIVASARIRG
jgi:hypothetical protein